MPFAAAAAVGVVGAVGGAMISADAAKSAAGDQLLAASNATNAELSMFGQTQANLAPFIGAGKTALGDLTDQGTQTTDTLGNPIAAGGDTSLLGQLNKPFQPTQAQLEQTPGYQFTLSQGLKATQNSMAASGLGRSGSALAAGAEYATGLASNTYQQQFSNYLTQNQSIFNKLTSLSNQGESAAAMQGTLGTQVGGQIASNAIGAGNAQAAGTVGAANAISGGLSSVGNQAFTFAALGQTPGLFGNPVSPVATGGGGGGNAFTGGGANGGEVG